MPDNDASLEREQRLRQAVDELAVQLVMAEDESAILRALGEVERLACASGRPELAEMVEGFLKQDAAAEVIHPDLAALGKAVERLQQALAEPASLSFSSPSAPADAAPASSGGGINILAQDPELVRDFVVESREHLAAIETHLLVVEQDPHASESLNAVFRGFHTIKGLAGFLELGPVQEVAHEVETILDLARSDRLTMTPEVIDLVLRGADYLRTAIDQVDAAAAGKPSGQFADNRNLINELRSLAAEEQDSGHQPQSPQKDRTAEPAGAAKPTAGETTPGQTGPEQSLRPAVASLSDSRTVKVDTGKLDHLVDMVGEMVIAQSLLKHDPDMAAVRTPRLQRIISQLSGITSDVQKTAMALRMVPIGYLFQRMGRVVRDLARKAGKQVELITEGEDTEIDRQIVEALADPLLHMIRNAIDHGLETPEARAAAGKNPTGRVRLAACHQSGQIQIEVGDDGRGLDAEKILKKAIERGLVAPGSQLNESEIANLIFEPGFSTAERVTDVSGRGVGMDVVKKNITRLRGRIEVSSARGMGTKFLLKLPLTLAIIDGLLVGVGKERYIVPIYSVLEMLRPSRQAVNRIPGQGETVLVRDSVLPIIRLHERFGVTPRFSDPWEALLIVAECEGKRFCMMVDEFLGKQEVVIKGLGDMLKNIRGIAGGAILGDGRVGLILDLEAIFLGVQENG